jgi:hypothetical protein
MRLRKAPRMGTIALEPAVSPVNATIRRAEAPERQRPTLTKEESIASTQKRRSATTAAFSIPKESSWRACGSSVRAGAGELWC